MNRQNKMTTNDQIIKKNKKWWQWPYDCKNEVTERLVGLITKWIKKRKNKIGSKLLTIRLEKRKIKWGFDYGVKKIEYEVTKELLTI